MADDDAWRLKFEELLSAYKRDPGHGKVIVVVEEGRVQFVRGEASWAFRKSLDKSPGIL